MQAVPDDRTLRRIIALLAALALLAERAAGRSFPVRVLVLAILRRAEPVACAFVADLVRIDVPERDDGAGAGPADAALLALRFRMLAALLAALLEPSGDRRAGHPDRDAASRRALTRARRPLAIGAAQAVAPDTS